MGMDPEEQKTRAEAAIRLVGLDFDSVKDKSPFALSGGEKRRAAIAGVLAMEPEVLILDEPTAGLDPEGREDILRLIKHVRESRQLTIILVSHDMDAVCRFADHVLVMSSGRLIMEGTPREVFARGDELRSVGLAQPAPAELLEKLRGRGLPLPPLEELGPEAFTPEGAAKLIKQYVNI